MLGNRRRNIVRKRNNADAKSKRGNGEGSVTQLADGRWQARVSEGGRRKAYYGRTREEAAGKLVDAMADARKGLPLPNERRTLGDFLEQWLEDSVKSRLRPNTLHGYSVNVRRHIIPALGKVPLARLTPQQVQRLLNDLRKDGKSARTVQYVHATLRAGLQQALRWGQVQRNVATLVNAPRVERPEIQPLSPEATQRLLGALRGDRLEALYTVALALGLRQGEALGLRWADIDFDARTMRVRCQLQRINGKLELVDVKTARGRRTIDLPDELLDTLRTHRVRQLEERIAAATWAESDLIFTTAIGTPLDRHNVTRYFQRILAQAGLPRQRFHDLRHLCASLLLAQGVPARVVMEILGHSGIQITLDTYAHVMPTMRRDAADRMNSLLRAAR
jgi:integrase